MAACRNTNRQHVKQLHVKKFQLLHNKINNLNNKLQVAHKQTNQTSYHKNTKHRIINLTHKNLKKEEMNEIKTRPLIHNGNKTQHTHK